VLIGLLCPINSQHAEKNEQLLSNNETPPEDSNEPPVETKPVTFSTRESMKAFKRAAQVFKLKKASSHNPSRAQSPTPPSPQSPEEIVSPSAPTSPKSPRVNISSMKSHVANMMPSTPPEKAFEYNKYNYKNTTGQSTWKTFVPVSRPINSPSENSVNTQPAEAGSTQPGNQKSPVVKNSPLPVRKFEEKEPSSGETMDPASQVPNNEMKHREISYSTGESQTAFAHAFLAFKTQVPVRSPSPYRKDQSQQAQSQVRATSPTQVRVRSHIVCECPPHLCQHRSKKNKSKGTPSRSNQQGRECQCNQSVCICNVTRVTSQAQGSQPASPLQKSNSATSIESNGQNSKATSSFEEIYEFNRSNLLTSPKSSPNVKKQLKTLFSRGQTAKSNIAQNSSAQVNTVQVLPTDQELVSQKEPEPASTPKRNNQVNKPLPQKPTRGESLTVNSNLTHEI
jgi:hypothetical protein